MNIVEENWDEILNKMKVEYCSSNISYNTWIAPLTAVSYTHLDVYKRQAVSGFIRLRTE